MNLRTSPLRTSTAAALLVLPALLAACAPPPAETPQEGTEPPTPGVVLPPGAGGTPTTAPPVEAPTTTTPPTTVAPAPAPRPPVAGEFPGDVAPGHVRWGAAIGGNADPVARHESAAGAPMGLRRTYFAWNKRTTSMVNMARADLAAGRLPWVSTKTPAWAAMAAGHHDAEIDAMLTALDALGGPVWLTLHHEPEDDVERGDAHAAGGINAWKGMQQRVRMRMDALGTRNIAFAPVLMSWTFDSRSGRDGAAWWIDGVWDFGGIDHYIEKLSHTTLEVPGFNNTRAFFASKGLKVAVGEWGNRGTDSSAANEMHGFYDAAKNSSGPGQIVGLAYFDSGLNSSNGSWELTGQPLAKFRELMRSPASLRAVQTRA